MKIKLLTTNVPIIYNLGQKYIDSASNLLNNPLPFQPFTILAQGVSFLSSNAQKQHCLRWEGDAYGYFVKDCLNFSMIFVCHVIQRVDCYLFVSLC